MVADEFVDDAAEAVVNHFEWYVMAQNFLHRSGR